MNNEIIESIPELNSSFPKNFGEIFIFIGKNIVNLVDFDNGNQLDKYLLGTTCDKLNHSGFLGNSIFKEFKKNNDYNFDINSDIDNNIDVSKKIFDYIQEYLHPKIIESLRELYYKDEILIKNGKKRIYFQNEVNRELGFDELDKLQNGKQKGRIVSEFLERYKNQGIIEFINNDGTIRNSKGKGKKFFRVIHNNYSKSIFIKPNTKKSKYHITILESLKKITQKNNNYRIKEEIYFENGIYIDSGYHFRYDIALYYNDKILFLIEVDGEQHFKFIKNWHKNLEGFEKQKNRDIIKDRFIINNNLKLLRIHYENIDNANKYIKYMIENIEIINNITYSESYNKDRNIIK